MTNSLAEYMKAIYIISNEQGLVRATDVAKSLGYTKPSVSRALTSLKAEGLIDYPPYGNVTLTEVGKDFAEKIMKSHDTLKLFLTDVLGISCDTAEEEAHSMKYAVSDHTISKLEQYINKILDLGELECGYDASNEKCRRCIKVTSRDKFKKDS